MILCSHWLKHYSQAPLHDACEINGRDKIRFLLDIPKAFWWIYCWNKYLFWTVTKDIYTIKHVHSTMVQYFFHCICFIPFSALKVNIQPHALSERKHSQFQNIYSLLVWLLHILPKGISFYISISLNNLSYGIWNWRAGENNIQHICKVQSF